MPLTPAQIELLIKIGIIVAIFVAGVGAGWTVNGWRLAGELERRQGVIETQNQSIETLTGANQRCTAGVADVKAAVKGYVDAGTKRSEAAAVAMKSAADAARGHLAVAKDALNRPMPATGKECDTAADEASAYAKKRKGAP